jgi:hypothetical protein
MERPLRVCGQTKVVAYRNDAASVISVSQSLGLSQNIGPDVFVIRRAKATSDGVSQDHDIHRAGFGFGYIALPSR